MKRFISNFTKQLAEAKLIGEQLIKYDNSKDIRNVIICGLGGSGIGGKIVSNISESRSNVPVMVHNSYSLPLFVNNETLVIISSYSGDTEETISAFNEALKRGCEIICITSGGMVERIAKENDTPIILVPGGNPPRAMLTYSLTQLLFILQQYSIIEMDMITEIENTISLLENEMDEIKLEAKDISDKVGGTTVLIYSDATFEGVGTRFKQQLNENSKTLAFSNVVPEMNHNELLGWQGGNKTFSAIFLRNQSDNERNKLRMDISKSEISKRANYCVDILSKGVTEIERVYYLILITDWISIHLAEQYGVDSIEIKVIESLKGKLKSN